MEYQAKELFAKHGVATTLGIVVQTAEEAKAAAEQLGGVTVVKAQVKAGGRGKAGGVKLAKTPDEAFEHATNILRHGDQGPAGQPRAGHAGHAAARGVLLLLPAGPVQPQLPVHRQRRGWCRDRRGRQDQPRGRPPDPDRRRHRRRRGQGARDRRGGQVPGRARRPGRRAMVQALWKVFVEEDATLVEVNPLARLEGDKLEALDGKVSLDENASEFRHPEHENVRGSTTRPTRSRPRPRPRASTTSSSTARSASSATARDSS